MIERISKCIQKVIGSEMKLNVDVNLNVYGLDSLLNVKVAVALEDEFDIEFDDKDLSQDNFRTINSMVALVKKYGVQ